MFFFRLQRPKVFQLESFSNCPGEDERHCKFSNLNITRVRNNVYIFNGDIVVTRNITFPIALSVDVHRCTLDKTHCEYYDHLTISKMCTKAKDAKQLWANIVSSIHPTPSCPFLVGTYTIRNASANLNPVERLPLDGYRWLTKFIVHEEGNPKNPTMCVDIDTTITVQKRRQNKNSRN